MKQTLSYICVLLLLISMSFSGLPQYDNFGEPPDDEIVPLCIDDPRELTRK
ncbi:MAG: hypothetical protein LBC71_05525 [Oscillospiraceae bacterium]|jgi:hypothetical protein|nr:hypothetical protein [Oscillospiraceae bacterium]